MLKLNTIIGMSSLIKDGLVLQNNSQNIIYASGNSIILEDFQTKEQQFLRGHFDEINTLCISKDGCLLASADKKASGFVSEIIVWCLKTMTILNRFNLHKGSVKKLAFSSNNCYLISIGGIDDKNRLIVWDLNEKKASYAFHLGNFEIRDVKFLNNNEDKFIAVTESNIQILSLNKKDKKINSLICNVGNIKRQFTTLIIDEFDEYMYCGAKTGDIIEIQINEGIMKKIGPAGKLFENGIKEMIIYRDNNINSNVLIVGSGDGKLTKVPICSMKKEFSTTLQGPISSIARDSNNLLYVSTEEGNIYKVTLNSDSFSFSLKDTNHVGRINDIVFPKNFSEVFATCGNEQIRVWGIKLKKELLRINLLKIECFSICFSEDGKSIISAWSDGKIRAFYPQSGKLMWQIEDAHKKGSTAINMTPNMEFIISGGMEGDIRLWKNTKNMRSLETSLKEHRSRVWSIKVRDNKEAISCSADGTCIIWNILTKTRTLCMFDKAIFKNVVSHPDGSQLVTVANDNKITYWSCFEGDHIRRLEGLEGEEGEISALDISPNGNYLITGGEDNYLRVWSYHFGNCFIKELGHCSGIVSAKISPNQENIVSCGNKGDLAIWTISDEIKTLK